MLLERKIIINTSRLFGIGWDIKIASESAICIIVSGFLMIFYFIHKDTIVFTDVPEYLIYAMETELRGLHLDPDVTSAPFSPLTGLQGATALDFDYADGMIAFSQIVGQKLSTMRVNDPQGSLADLVVHSNSTGTIENTVEYCRNTVEY